MTDALTLEERQALTSLFESNITMAALRKLWEAEKQEASDRLDQEIESDDPSVLRMRSYGERKAVFRRMEKTLKDRMRRDTR